MATALLCGCASVDFDYPKPESHVVMDTEDTFLGQRLAGLADQHPGESGFLPLGNGIDALAARLLLARRAERSIDAQYYLIKNDITGNAFIHALLQAADRGVRVRLLVDDMFTGGYDAGMAGLDSHPNFEIRIFNPFARRSARFMDGLTSFSRINRRMHNKSFTIDNQITIIGGRNIADEYFGAREDAKFSDLDVVGIGPVVQDVSDMFDSYWNHERAAPIAAFADMPDDPAAELERVRDELEQAKQRIITTRYADAVKEQVLHYVETDAKPFIWAPYVLAVDSPDKTYKKKANEVASIKTPLRESLLSAKSEVIIVSPYFVPRKTGIEALSAMQASGVEVIVITNSLAANNQASVHGGYAPSRKPLLESGVQIFEVRDDADVSGSELVAASGAKAPLHTKAFIVDRREVFIGSFNFDPRSANINTELGVIIRSTELANHYADRILAALPEQTFEVFLNENGKLRWRGLRDGEEVIFDKEPHTTWWQRFVAGFMRILPIRGQL
ncbi:MAG: phospholipase D family protein [Proteobacteria bacterium]|nr:phospholipase D family protein [Pseudomonadota bacterium]